MFVYVAECICDRAGETTARGLHGSYDLPGGGGLHSTKLNNWYFHEKSILLQLCYLVQKVAAKFHFGLIKDIISIYYSIYLTV